MLETTTTIGCKNSQPAQEVISQVSHFLDPDCSQARMTQLWTAQATSTSLTRETTGFRNFPLRERSYWHGEQPGTRPASSTLHRESPSIIMETSTLLTLTTTEWKNFFRTALSSKLGAHLELAMDNSTHHTVSRLTVRTMSTLRITGTTESKSLAV